MLCSYAASAISDWMPIFARDAIIQDVHVVGAYLIAERWLGNTTELEVGVLIARLGVPAVVCRGVTV